MVQVVPLIKDHLMSKKVPVSLAWMLTLILVSLGIGIMMGRVWESERQTDEMYEQPYIQPPVIKTLVAFLFVDVRHQLCTLHFTL